MKVTLHSKAASFAFNKTAFSQTYAQYKFSLLNIKCTADEYVVRTEGEMGLLTILIECKLYINSAHTHCASKAH